jgi:hypothetical protein
MNPIRLRFSMLMLVGLLFAGSALSQESPAPEQSDPEAITESEETGQAAAETSEEVKQKAEEKTEEGEQVVE